MGKRRNNGRNSETIKLYNLIIDNDEIRDVANKFCDNDEILDFAERNWEDEDDSYINLIEDIMDDSSVLRGFSPRRFIPAISEWLNENFVYHNGDIALVLEDIAILCSKASKETLEAYTGVTIICGNIMKDYNMEANNDIAVLATVHAIRATLNHIKDIGDSESYTAASSSTEEPKQSSDDKKKDKSEDSKDSSKPKDKKDSNASKVDAEELKDKIDLESIAQNIYSEVKDSGKLESMIMQGIIEGLRQITDGGKMTQETEQDIINKINNTSSNTEDLLKDVSKIIIDGVLGAMSGDKSSIENVINRLRNKGDNNIIDVEESDLKEVTDILPVEDDNKGIENDVFGSIIKLKPVRRSNLFGC